MQPRLGFPETPKPPLPTPLGNTTLLLNTHKRRGSTLWLHAAGISESGLSRLLSGCKTGELTTVAGTIKSLSVTSVAAVVMAHQSTTPPQASVSLSMLAIIKIDLLLPATTDTMEANYTPPMSNEFDQAIKRLCSAAVL